MARLCVKTYTAQLIKSQVDALSSLKGQFELQIHLHFCIYCSGNHTADIPKRLHVFTHMMCLSCLGMAPLSAALYRLLCTTVTLMYTEKLG